MFDIEIVWPSPAESVRDEAISLWVAESALPDRASAEARAKELLAVARDSGGTIAGLSTAAITSVPRFAGYFCYYRSFVASSHRHSGVASELFYATIPYLNARHASGEDRRARGVYVDHEPPASLSPAAAERFWAPVWEIGHLKMHYVGRNRKGAHQRVLYFDGATVD